MSAPRIHSPVNQDEQVKDGLASLQGPCEDGMCGVPKSPSNHSPYPLSSLDHNPLGMNVTFLLSFQTTQPEESIRVLDDGIKQLLKVHPFLSGDVTRQTKVSQRKNTWQIEPDAPESLLKLPMLQTQYLQAESIKELHSKRLLTGAEEQEIMRRLAPLPIDMDLSLPRRPIVRFQANIMRDGVILAMTFHHAAMDGAGAARVLGLLADCCRDRTASSSASVVSDRQLRSQIDSLASKSSSGASRADFSQHYCGLGDWAALLAENWSGFLRARATELVTWRLTIPGSKIQYLKGACNALLQGQTSAQAGRPNPGFLSNNDIVSALMAMILRQAGRLAGQSTELSLAVDMRGNFQAPAFNDYLGNMVLLTYTPIPAGKNQPPVDGPVPAELRQECLKELTQIAARIRHGLLSVNAEYIQGVLSHLHSQTDWAEIGFRGVPIPLSSFRNFGIFGLDFGESLGSQPRGFQLHLPVLGGMCFILPKRQDSTEPWDLHLTLNRDDVSMVSDDPLFRWATEEHL
ncbi:O-acetyltransferase pyr7 [Aspergillus thermomutatus]|uniref:CTP synthase n=1 Tax=Aspergillus thermomutatus TaxID=41047 RepID=A0A397H2V2_ASPTH|nr:CTP synthase [Aspergillus thermomutatus]RHZ57401.1 CTP synthase [Aspergillus thermomutatus]